MNNINIVFPNRNFDQNRFNRIYRIRKFDLDKKHKEDLLKHIEENRSNLGSSTAINKLIELRQKQFRDLSKLRIDAIIESFNKNTITKKDIYYLNLKFNQFLMRFIEDTKKGFKTALLSYGLPSGAIILDTVARLSNELNKVYSISKDMLTNEIEDHNNKIQYSDMVQNITNNEHNSGNDHIKEEDLKSIFDEKIVWEKIKIEFEYPKTKLAKKINFISDAYKKKIIFRDIAQSYYLYKKGCYKPSVILAGGVIEEMLKEFLKKHRVSPLTKDFFGYIKACEDNGLLKKGISKLSDSVREFRNLVHLNKEKSKQDAILNTKALNAVASIFTIADDF